MRKEWLNDEQPYVFRACDPPIRDMVLGLWTVPLISP